jgi:aspartyl protease family protein
MAQTSTLGHVLGTAGNWLFAGACGVACVFYFDDLRGLGRWALGVPALEQEAADLAARANAKRDEAATSNSSGSTVELIADRRGHFSTAAQVNGASIEVLVDTGATNVALTFEDAERAGIFVRPQDFTHRANTANGVARIAPIMIDSISIGGITVRDVQGSVAERGKLNETLLGMTFLGRLSKAQMSRGRLLLEE